MVTALGSMVLHTVEETGALGLRTARLVHALVRGALDARECVRQTQRFLRDALPLALVSSLVVGGVVAMQGLGYLQRYNATLVFGWAAGVSAFRDVGPMLLGFCLSARTGSKNAAELASMAARERLDAVRALGLNAERVVVLPRAVATAMVAALLYLPMCALVLGTAFVLAFVLGGQNVAVSVASFTEYVEPAIIGNGLLRMLCFGALIGLCSCHAGARVQDSDDKSARAIGGAVFSSSVLSLCGVVLGNLVFSLWGGT